MSEQNKRVVERIFDQLFNADRVDLVPDLYTDDVVGHDPANRIEVQGHAEFRRVVEGYRAAFPHHRYVVHTVIGEGAFVAARWSVFDDTFADGEEEVVQGLSLCRFRDGRVCEVWQHWDNLGFLQKLEAVDSSIDLKAAIGAFISGQSKNGS